MNEAIKFIRINPDVAENSYGDVVHLMILVMMNVLYMML